MPYKLSFDAASGEVVMDKKDKRERLNPLTLDYKVKLAKHVIMAFLAYVNKDLDPSPKLLDDDELEVKTTQDLTLFDLWKWLVSIEEGYYDKYVKKFLGPKFEQSHLRLKD